MRWWNRDRCGGIRLGYSDLLSLRSVFPTMRAEDHTVELGHTGLVEAVSHSEIRVAF